MNQLTNHGPFVQEHLKKNGRLADNVRTALNPPGGWMEWGIYSTSGCGTGVWVEIQAPGGPQMLIMFSIYIQNLGVHVFHPFPKTTGVYHIMAGLPLAAGLKPWRSRHGEKRIWPVCSGSCSQGPGTSLQMFSLVQLPCTYSSSGQQPGHLSSIK